MSKRFFSIISLLIAVAGHGQSIPPNGNDAVDIRDPNRFISHAGFSVGPSIPFAHGGGWLRRYGVLKVGYAIEMNLVHSFSKKSEGTLSIGYERKGLRGIIHSEERIFTFPVNQKLIMDLSLDYVTAAFHFRHSILKNEKVFVGAGPYFGYLVVVRLSSEVYLNGSLVTKSNGNPDRYFDYEKYDFGVSALTGLKMTVAGRPGVIQLLYNHGMKNIDHPVIGELRNASIVLLFGLTLSKNQTRNR